MKINISLQKSVLLKNSILVLFGKAVAAISVFGLDILLARYLSIYDYAEWAFFFSVLTMFYFLGGFGVNASTKVYVSKCQDDLSRKYCIIGGIFVRIIISILLAAGIFLFMPKLSYNMGYPEKYHDLYAMLQWASFATFNYTIVDFLKELNTGLQDYKCLLRITLLEYIGYFVISVCFLFLGKEIMAPVYAYSLSEMFTMIFGTFLFFNWIRSIKAINIKEIKHYSQKIVKYAFPLLIINIAGMVLVEMDTFMLGILGKKSDVAIYSIAKSICSKATQINFAIVTATMTAFSIITRESFNKVKKKYNLIIWVNFVIAFLVSMLFFFFGDQIIILLYGNKYTQAPLLLKLLIPYYFIYASMLGYSAFLDFQRKATKRSVFLLTSIVTNLVLNLWWIPLFGVEGAIYSTNISLIPYAVLATIESKQVWKRIRKSVL